MIVTENGKISAILVAGKHSVRTRDSEFESHDIDSSCVLNSKLENALIKTAPTLAQTHLLSLRTGPDELKIIHRDKVLMMVMKPDRKLSLWKDAGPLTSQDISVDGASRVAPNLAQRLRRAGLVSQLASFEVPEGFVGLMFVDGVLEQQLKPGQHDFWNSSAKINVSLIDLRLRAHEVNGQEILTKDRVSLRVNISAEFKVSDPEKPSRWCIIIKKRCIAPYSLLFARRWVR